MENFGELLNYFSFVAIENNIDVQELINEYNIIKRLKDDLISYNDKIKSFSQ